MTNQSLRSYFASKYKQKFGKQYHSKNKWSELTLLTKLLDKYSYYLILEAIDRFISEIDLNRASVCYFASDKVFKNKFFDLIRRKEVVKYRRLLPLYSLENQKTIKKLLWEYDTYLGAISLSKEDLDKKKEIISILEGLKIAEGFRDKDFIFNKGL